MPTSVLCVDFRIFFVMHIYIYISQWLLAILFPQKAMKEKNIDLWSAEKDVLGTEREKQPPKKPESKK